MPFLPLFYVSLPHFYSTNFHTRPCRRPFRFGSIIVALLSLSLLCPFQFCLGCEGTFQFLFLPRFRLFNRCRPFREVPLVFTLKTHTTNQILLPHHCRAISIPRVSGRAPVIIRPKYRDKFFPLFISKKPLCELSSFSFLHCTSSERVSSHVSNPRGRAAPYGGPTG